jgi:general nucleoside transport system permease protein
LEVVKEPKNKKIKIKFASSKIFKAMLPVMGIFVGALVGALVILAKGVSPIEAYTALLDGAFGSLDSLSNSLIKTIPLGFTGLAIILSYKAGIFNIGAEGQLHLGAVAATLVGTMFIDMNPVLHITLCFLIAAIFGGIFGLLPGLAKAYKGFNEIVITTLLNYIAILFVSYLIQGPMKMKDQYFPQSAPLSKSAVLPVVIPGTQLHLGIILLVITCIIVYFVIFKTTFGFKMRAVGFNLRAAQYGGVDSRKIMALSMAISGAVAGIAGATEIMGVQGRLIENFSPGYGYDAIAVALLANLNPLWLLLSSFFFGALRNGANSMQIATGVPVSFVYIIQALAVLFVVGSTGMPRFMKIVRRARKNA